MGNFGPHGEEIEYGLLLRPVSLFALQDIRKRNKSICLFFLRQYHAIQFVCIFGHFFKNKNTKNVTFLCLNI